MGGYAWLRQSMAGLQCVSSARLRCARALWAVAGHLPESEEGGGEVPGVCQPGVGCGRDGGGA